MTQSLGTTNRPLDWVWNFSMNPTELFGALWLSQCPARKSNQEFVAVS
jgi:hypothetical protein